MGLLTIAIILVVIFLAIIVLLNWSCLSESLNSGKLCLRADYGLGELGLTAKNSTCVCSGGTTTHTTSSTPEQTTQEEAESETETEKTQEVPLPS